MTVRDIAPEFDSSLRKALQMQLVDTRRAFHAALDRLDDEALRRPSRNPKWTNGALLTHIVLSLRFIPLEVSMAKRGRGMFNIPKWLFDPINAIGASQIGRWQSCESLRKRFDAAHDAALRSLNQLDAQDFARGGNFYGTGFHSIRDLFENQASHFTEHANDITFD